MSGPTFVRMYPTDWRSGCLGLSLEEEGMYMRVCMFIAETGRRVPLDDSQGARMLGGMNVNQYRKVLGQLLMKGKVKRHEDGYGNDRIEHETQAAKSAAGKRATEAEDSPHREANSDQGRQDHEASVTTTPPVTPPVTRGVTPPVTPLVEVDFSKENQSPFIEPITKKDSICGAREKRGARLPAEWALPKSWGDWTRTNFPQSNDNRVRLEAEKFRDFWHAKAGKDACKLDWEATWRNWCRNAFAARNDYAKPDPATTKVVVHISEAQKQRDYEAWLVKENMIQTGSA